MDEHTAAPSIDPLGPQLVDPVREEDLREVWRAVDEQRSRSLPWVPAYRPVAAGMLASAAIIFVVWSLQSPTSDSSLGPLARADGAALDVDQLNNPGSASASTALNDGSKIVTEPGTEAQILANSDRDFELLVLRGRVRFEVKPGGQRRWTVETGIARVEVIGTVFVVDRNEHSVHVIVERGVVIVRAESLANGVRRLVAGERLEVRGDEAPTPGEPALAFEEAQEPAPAVALERAPSSVVAAPERNWIHQAQEGDFDGAYSELGPEGIAREVERAQTVEDLFRLVDVARRSGHPRDSVGPLSEIVSQHRSDPRASLAAFTLGGIEMRTLGRPGQAAEAFRTSLDLGLAQGLREDALARLVEAHSRAGALFAAREAASRYAREFPNGRHAESIDAWLEQR